MFYLIYVSSATKRMNNEELLALQQEASDNNKRLNVTGVFLYQDGTFMQMLEGEKNTVLDLYAKIQTDNRHKGVITMLEGDIEERNFHDWSMGFFNMDKVTNHANYNDYIKDNIALKSFHKDSQDAYKFMLLFNKINR